MVSVDNIAAKLCANISKQDGEANTREWRLLCQERDGTLLFTWIRSINGSRPNSCIGLYHYADDKLETFYSFDYVVNIIQASINSGHDLLGFVKKEKVGDADRHEYSAFLVECSTGKQNLIDLNIRRREQVMIQFLYHKQSKLKENEKERFLLFVHEECIWMYTTRRNLEDELKKDPIIKTFVWAQWDTFYQTLFYIHHRKPVRSSIEGEEIEIHDEKLSPVLSGLQFHDDLPHESVLNIPLNLPNLIHATFTNGEVYEDDIIPLRIHNSSLDLIVLMDSDGVVCICHHYLYQPTHHEKEITSRDDEGVLVNLAYSVTVLHHGCVVHCVVPSVPWKQAKTIKPLFKLHNQSVLVFIPGICLQLLDIGSNHEPSCHILMPVNIPGLEPHQTNLAHVETLGKHCALNLPTLDVVDLFLPTAQFVESFKEINSVENRLSILHHLLVHEEDVDTAIELLAGQMERQTSELPGLFREFLIGSSYAIVRKNLPSDAVQLTNLLPVTTQSPYDNVEIPINGKLVTLSQEVLWNTSVMLLSPQQRLIPYRSDIWTNLWEHSIRNTKGKQKFKPGQVVDKLLVSLVCYQPEALSRSNTPMSPATNLSFATVNITKEVSSKYVNGSLPFHEIESCTASKQEHVISVNLRELTMHLLKQSTENRFGRFQCQGHTPVHIHAVAARYVAAQLEQSRTLCQVSCRVSVAEMRYEEKGFTFIDKLPDDLRHVLYSTLEQYYLSVESLAFPLPQGFMSFFTYLGYRTLQFPTFVQYVLRHVFELQVDAVKAIIADIGDTKLGIERKLMLLSVLPRTRAKRLLNQWNHPLSLMIRAREHALNILSGVESSCGRLQGARKTHGAQLGLAAFPKGDRLSPLDTFLDLLTAKANLHELDFGLLREATLASTEDFLCFD